MNNKAKGYALGAIAAATYGMNPLFALPLYADGMNPDSVLFFRYLFAIPLVGLMLKARGRSLRVERRALLPLAGMGLLVALSSLALFLSYNYIAAGIASTMLFVYPILVALIMTLVFHERITLQTVVCIALALVGIGLLYRSADGLKHIATLKVTFYVLLFGLVLFVARFACGVAFTLPHTWYLWGCVVALAVFPTAISFLCTTSAIQYIGSTPTAILGALEPVTAVFFGVTVFGESLTFRESVGLALIIAAVTLVVAGGRLSAYLVRFRKLFPRLPLRRRKNA